MGKQSAPVQPTYGNSYAEGVKADAASVPLRLMAEQAARMSRLIDDLLSLSRIELSEHTPPSDSIDLAALAARARRRRGRMAGAPRGRHARGATPPLRRAGRPAR